MTPAAANLSVSLIGALRSKTTFGLSKKSVLSIMAYCDDFERRNSQWLRQFEPGFVDILASFMATPEYAALFGLADGAERAEMS